LPFLQFASTGLSTAPPADDSRTAWPALPGRQRSTSPLGPFTLSKPLLAYALSGILKPNNKCPAPTSLDSLIHFIKASQDGEAYEILRQIARDRALRRGSGLIKGAYTCVCFADLSLSLARHLYWRLCVPVAPRQPRQWSPSGFDAASLFQRSMTTCSSKRV
jgi:hypothetical protein